MPTPVDSLGCSPCGVGREERAQFIAVRGAGPCSWGPRDGGRAVGDEFGPCHGGELFYEGGTTRAISFVGHCVPSSADRIGGVSWRMAGWGSGRKCVVSPAACWETVPPAASHAVQHVRHVTRSG
jgi:hypothetical protein